MNLHHKGLSQGNQLITKDRSCKIMTSKRSSFHQRSRPNETQGSLGHGQVPSLMSCADDSPPKKNSRLITAPHRKVERNNFELKPVSNALRIPIFAGPWSDGCILLLSQRSHVVMIYFTVTLTCTYNQPIREWDENNHHRLVALKYS